MKRVRASACILLVLMLVSIASLLWLRAESREYAMLAKACSDAYAAGDIPAALERCETLTEEWEQFHSIAGLFVDGDKLDPIRETLSGLRPLIAAGHPDAAADLARLRIMLRELYEEETPEFWHIL